MKFVPAVAGDDLSLEPAHDPARHLRAEELLQVPVVREEPDRHRLDRWATYRQQSLTSSSVKIDVGLMAPSATGAALLVRTVWRRNENSFVPLASLAGIRSRIVVATSGRR